MPANVTYEYIAAQKKLEEAKTDEEKIIALQSMLSAAPSHKGAENLRRDISRRIADLKNKIEKRAAQQKKTGHSINIKKEGAGQVALLGLANSGKSTFLTEFTNAKPTIANYPYTTTKPEVGILNYGGALIQLVEVPSFMESKELASQIFSIIRLVDAIVLVVPNTSPEQLDRLIELLESQDIFITKKKPKVKLNKSEYPGITFINEHYLKIPKEEATLLLKGAGFRSHTVVLREPLELADLLLLINPRAVYIPSISVFMPYDAEKELLKKEYKNIKLFNFKNKTEITEKIFKMVNKVIVYTKRPGGKADLTDPLVLEKGTKVIDAAKQIHKTISKDLKSAKVWGSTKFPGQTVSKNYVLQDKDIVEFVI